LMICKPNLVTGSMRNRKPEHLSGCRPRPCEVSCYRHGCDPPEPESLLPDCTTPLTHHRTRPLNVTSPLTLHFHFFHHLLCKRGGVNCVVWGSVLFRCVIPRTPLSLSWKGGDHEYDPQRGRHICARISEYLLSRFIDPALNQDERDLIVYYVVQLAQMFEHERSEYERSKTTSP